MLPADLPVPLALLIVSLLTSPLLAAEKKKDPLANWKTKFDFSKAEYMTIRVGDILRQGDGNVCGKGYCKRIEN